MWLQLIVLLMGLISGFIVVGFYWDVSVQFTRLYNLGQYVS